MKFDNIEIDMLFARLAEKEVTDDLVSSPDANQMETKYYLDLDT
jgi:poly(A) polymerase Pap1